MGTSSGEMAASMHGAGHYRESLHQRELNTSDTAKIIWPGSIEGVMRNGLDYDPFPYRFYGYPRAARNLLEHKPDVVGEKAAAANRAVLEALADRHIGPRRLFMLRDPASSEMLGHDLVDMQNHPHGATYVFVAFAAEQFAMQNWDELHLIGERAARDAKVEGFWVSSRCIEHDDPFDPMEVYQISDIVRASSRLVVAVGPSRSNTVPQSFRDMVKQWSERVWTFPELLLSTPGKAVKIYVRGNIDKPVTWSKLSFAANAFADAQKARSLIDHYEGSTILSRLELTTLAYECIQSRHTKSYLPGDHSYALMGLLNLRSIDPSDSAFQAFARLSLLNDSDRLLERLICMLPEESERSWSTTTDKYSARLHDIEPWIQVSGLGDDDTVIIDGARAARVRWEGFETVYSERRKTWGRAFAKFFLRISGLMMLIGILLVHFIPLLPAIGAPFLLYGIMLILLSPWLLRLMYSGKFWRTQAMFFGFEGYMPLHEIEKRIFGARLGRMKWAPYSSPISRHRPNDYDECIGVDPMTDAPVQAKVASAKSAQYGQPRLFTLGDTATMTVTLFEAVRPPVAFLLVGSEGGMQRALGVSYDWESKTLVKETVLRMETPVMERMARVPRVKLSLGRAVPKTKARFIANAAY